MKKWTCHDLGHSFAHNFLKRGGQMYQLQAILGHRQIRITLDLYGQLSAVDLQELINQTDKEPLC
jgi:site-specific recombinase XerD